jgi:hypothetical protein
MSRSSQSASRYRLPSSARESTLLTAPQNPRIRLHCLQRSIEAISLSHQLCDKAWQKFLLGVEEIRVAVVDQGRNFSANDVGQRETGPKSHYSLLESAVTAGMALVSITSHFLYAETSEVARAKVKMDLCKVARRFPATSMQNCHALLARRRRITPYRSRSQIDPCLTSVKLLASRSGRVILPVAILGSPAL